MIVKLIETEGEQSWGDGAIWSTGAVPQTGDDVFIEAGDLDLEIIAGLNQSGVILNSLNISLGFLGVLGTRDVPLRINAHRVNLCYAKGVNVQSGSPRIHLDLGDEVSVVTIFNSASSAVEPDAMPIRVKANNAITVIHIRGGRVGIADLPGETSRCGIINVVDGRVLVGPIQEVEGELTGGVTGPDLQVDRLYVAGGSVVSGATVGVLECDGGTVRTEGINAVTQMVSRGGEIVSNSTGTINDLELWGGIADFAQSAEERAIGTVTLKDKGFTWTYRRDVLTVGEIVNEIDALVSVTVN